MNREAALARIRELAREHDLDASEVMAVLRPSNAAPPGAPDWVRSLLAVVGGLLVLAGLVGLLQLVWDDLVPPARVLTVFGSGVVLLVLGLAACRDRAFEAAAAPLLLVAGLFQTAGLFVLLNEYGGGLREETGALLVFAAVAAQFGLLFAALKRTDLLFLLLLSGTLAIAAALIELDVDGEWIALIVGFSGLLLTFGLERTRWHALCGMAWLGYAGCLSTGLFELVEGVFPLDLLLVVAAALLIQLSVYVRNRALLVGGVLIMLAYLGYFTGEYFADALGWPIALIAFGLVLLALSGYALRMGRSMARPNREHPDG